MLAKLRFQLRDGLFQQQPLFGEIGVPVGEVFERAVGRGAAELVNLGG